MEEITSSGGKAVGIVCHVGNAEDRKRLVDFTVKEYGGIDM